MVAVVILDKSLRCDFVNAVAEALTGFTLAQARQLPVAELLWRANPDEATTDWRAVCVMWPSELCGACVAETHSYLAHDC